MDINDLTIRQVKELATIFSNKSQGNITDSLLGEYVIVRSRNEGINAGFVVKADETGIVLKDARRIWYHKPKDKGMSWYEGVAISGLSDDSKISASVPLKIIVEDYSIVHCSITAKKSIQEHKSHAQS